MRISVLIASLLFVSTLAAAAPDPLVVYLWPSGAPGSEGKTGEEKVQVQGAGDHVISNVHKPSITVFLPSKETATGVGIVIAPGGGHSTLWVDHEGYNIAKWLQEHGIAGFVLKYRLAREKGSTYTIEGTSLSDTQRAIKLVKSNSSEWGVDPARIGMIGFSAGGELAALAATHVDEGKADAADPIDRLSSKVGFFGLMYPAIPKDMPLSKDMPPAFFVCGEMDRQDISQGLPELYVAMKKAGAQAELHVYAKVGHGFGVRATTKGPVAQWPQRFYDWMDNRGLLKAKS
jgi:acetyl esterase/lipase